MKRKVLICLLLPVLTSASFILYAQPYYDTYVKNSHVSLNQFLSKHADTSALPQFDIVKADLPQPNWPGREDVIKCYWKAWELAFGNLHKPAEGSGFVSPFIDPAFNGHIFMWDTHFMLLFGRYGSRAFNFQQSLDNFYARQHPDGFICREIVESDGSDFFERFDVSSTGPNVFPWTEWEYYLNFADTIRLRKVFDPLLAYYEWFSTYRSWPDGSYFSSGWGCGMDNQPRLPKGYDPAWSHGKMSWIDITLQQIYAAKILIRMADVLGREADISELKHEVVSLTDYVNTRMWDEKTNFYYDRFSDGSLSGVKSIASYWALLAGIVNNDRLSPFIRHLENPDEFARKHRVATLSADSREFDPGGGYWRGSVWAPTNYMVLRGLTASGEDSLAFEIARNHLGNVVNVFTNTGTLFENYAPDYIRGNDRKDFVGWTGIVPISVLFEYVFGLRPDVPENLLILDVRMTDAYGVSNYPFGRDGVLDIQVKKRNRLLDKPNVTVKSNTRLNVKLIWDGGSEILHILPTA